MSSLLRSLSLPLISLLLIVSAAPADAKEEGSSAEAASGDGELFHIGKPSQKKPLVGLPDFSELVDPLRHAVVNISSESSSDDEEEAQEDEDSEALPPFLRPDPKRPVRSLGSGFFINPEGFIVTNHHVVQNADTVYVRIPDDKKRYEADVIGYDDKTDIALIKIKADGPFDYLKLGSSDSLKIGEWVLAIGNQFQLGQTFTAGIVSAKSRRVPIRTSGPYDQFIQTDASINPGSSGGPLVNTAGEVVGINTAIFSPGRQQFGSGSGFNIGIGFSIPIDLAKGILVQLKESGKVTRGLLGVIIQAVTINVKKALNLKEARGALVADVLADTPAEQADFQRRDIILSYQGTPIESHDDLPLLVANTKVGEVVEVEVLRGDKKVKLYPKIGKLQKQFRRSPQRALEPDRLGLLVEPVSARYSEQIGQSEPSGVVVASVEPNSPAEDAGIQRGDVIEELGTSSVKGLSDYQAIINRLKPGETVLVLVRKKVGTRYLTLEMPE